MTNNIARAVWGIFILLLAIIFNSRKTLFISFFFRRFVFGEESSGEYTFN